jgi:hypothetical protein
MESKDEENRKLPALQSLQKQMPLRIRHTKSLEEKLRRLQDIYLIISEIQKLRTSERH